MFFSISKQIQKNFPNQYLVGEFVINTDPGWDIAVINGSTVVYKGYADRFDLSSNLEFIISDTKPHVSGNFCILEYTNNCIKIHSSLCRSFPIYIDDFSVNNLVSTDKIVWANQLLTINADMSTTETKFNVVGDIDDSVLTRQEVETEIVKILDNKTKDFLSYNTLPIKVFLSGGVDSLLVYSFLQKHTSNFEKIKYFHVDLDHFWLSNYGDIIKFWAYNQIHHWESPTILTSGAPGDEFTLRAPLTGGMALKFHGIDILDLVKKNDGMQKTYFLQDKNIKTFNDVIKSPPIKNKMFLIHQLCTMNSNDWQHWHIGNTLTWTPLRDLEIFKLFLRLPIEDQIDQFLDSKITKNIIERNCPGLSRLVADQKNSGNWMKNLVDK